MFEQEANKIQQQLQLIEQNIVELQGLEEGIKEIDKSKEKQMLANLGKGIFIKTEIQDKNLIVDVGNKTFVKKSPEDTIKIIKDQIGQLGEAKNQFLDKLQEIQMEMEKIIVEVEKENKDHQCNDPSHHH